MKWNARVLPLRRFRLSQNNRTIVNNRFLAPNFSLAVNGSNEIGFSRLSAMAFDIALNNRPIGFLER
jgi:hypothetical protein